MIEKILNKPLTLFLFIINVLFKVLFSVLKINLSIPAPNLIFCHLLVNFGVNANTLLKGTTVQK